MHELPATRGAVALVRCPPAHRADVERRAAVLADAYRVALAQELRHRLWWVRPGIGVWALTDGALPAEPRLVLGAVLTGTPEQALAEPADLGGVWTVVAPHGGGVRAVTSASLVRTLVRADTGSRTAVASRGLAALALAGAPLRISAERMPELVRFDFVLGDDELLEGTRVLDEAAVVDFGDDVRVASWWPRARRFAPGDPMDPDRLRAAVGAAGARMLAHDDARLGLTAGLDSLLLARGTVEAGVRPRAFTFGWEGNADSDGAREVAQALGLRHEVARVEPGRATLTLDRLVEFAPWGEGQVNPRPLGVGPIAWDARDVVWVSGHGGELGRAFYWSGEHPRPGELPRRAAALAADLGGTSPEVQALLAERVRVDFERAAGLCGDGARALDGFYALGRMRKWTDRIVPFRHFRGVAAPMLAPDAVRALLDLPEHLRRDGSGMRAAAGRPTELPSRSLARRGVGRALRAVGLRRRPTDPYASLDAPLVAALAAAAVARGSAARDALGATWWDGTVAFAQTQAWAQLVLWNAFAIDSLALALPDLRRRLDG